VLADRWFSWLAFSMKVILSSQQAAAWLQAGSKYS